MMSATGGGADPLRSPGEAERVIGRVGGWGVRGGRWVGGEESTPSLPAPLKQLQKSKCRPGFL